MDAIYSQLIKQPVLVLLFYSVNRLHTFLRSRACRLLVDSCDQRIPHPVDRARGEVESGQSVSVATAQYLGQSDPDEISAFSLGSTTRIRHINISGLGAGSGSSTLFSFPCLLPLHLPGVFFLYQGSVQEEREIESGSPRESQKLRGSCHFLPPL
jgi:hypothetical protein